MGMTTATVTAQGRLAMWADDVVQKVDLWSEVDRYGGGLPLWSAEAEARPGPMQGGLRVRVTVGPCADPESACTFLIERLAQAGVVVP